MEKNKNKNLKIPREWHVAASDAKTSDPQPLNQR